MTGSPVNPGDVFHDAPNHKGLARTLDVGAVYSDGTARCRERGTDLFPRISLADLADESKFLPGERP